MCSYCGCQSIGIIGRFSTEHAELINVTGLLRRDEDFSEHIDTLCGEHVDLDGLLAHPCR